MTLYKYNINKTHFIDKKRIHNQQKNVKYNHLSSFFIIFIAI